MIILACVTTKADLFAGVGGFTLGFLEASASHDLSFDVRLLVDKDPDAKETFKRNHPSMPYLVVDIAQCTGSLLRERTGIGRHQEVHILRGGPPCQAFSRVGKRVLTDPRNALVLDFLRLVKELRPMAVLMENVPLIMTAFDGVVMQEIRDAFADLGYETSADIVAASDYGVPQFRKRAIMMAYRNDLHVKPSLPNATHERIDYAARLPQRRRRSVRDGLLAYIPVEDAIGDLPTLKAGEGDEYALYTKPATTDFQHWAREESIALFNHRAREHASEYLEKIKVIKEGSRNASLSDDERFSDTISAKRTRGSIAGALPTRLQRISAIQALVAFFTIAICALSRFVRLRVFNHSVTRSSFTAFTQPKCGMWAMRCPFCWPRR